MAFRYCHQLKKEYEDATAVRTDRASKNKVEWAFFFFFFLLKDVYKESISESVCWFESEEWAAAVAAAAFKATEC